MKNSKILHITTAHKNDDVRIFQKEVCSLKKEGFNVSLIAQGEKDEIINGINIYAVPFSKNRFDRFFFTNLKILYRIIKINPKICHFHDPDFILGALFLNLLGKKIIYDVHEDVPKQIMSKYWIPKFLRKLIAISFNVLEKFISRFFFNSIITATDSISKNFPKYKTSIINNYPIIDDLKDFSENYVKKENSIIYIGGISVIRGIVEMIDAFEKLPNKNIKFYIAGNFNNIQLEQDILKRIKSNGNIIFLGFIKREKLLKYMFKSRIGLVLFHPEQNHIESSPNKMFEYMSLGIPVVASNFPLWNDIIINNKCGLTIDPLDSKEISSTISTLLNNPDKAEYFGNNGKRVVTEKFNWNIEEKKLVKLYLRILDES